MRILHAIHDFLPRHRAGSELYAYELCRALAAEHDVTVLCADFDPSRPHGRVDWRVHDGLPVVEVVNNWPASSFEETYRPPLVNDRIGRVLHAVQPHVVHVHNLQNLSFDLPRLARARGASVVATLHDYTLVCPSGGQRIHRAEQHLCDVIDTERCARCFPESPVAAHIAWGRIAARAHAPRVLGRLWRSVRRYPRLTRRLQTTIRRQPPFRVTRQDIDRRLDAARAVFDDVDLFVAPSRSIGSEFERLGVEPQKIKVSDYGVVPLPRGERPQRTGPLRIGYVGTIVWHKGVHVLVDAVRGLSPSAYTLSVFGNPDTFADYSAALRARAAGLPVRFEGPFDRTNAADVYSQIDVLVVPSLWLENSPFVVHEAFQAGIPVVGARIGGIAELVADGRTGLLFEPGSTPGLLAALRDLVEHPERLGALSEHVRSMSRAKSIGEDALEWSAIYANLAARRRGRPA